MLSINTNLSSLIAQNSMKTSTDRLNLAIERMTSGAKINHAKDNAANYSIATNLTTKIGAYDVAADNVAMGMDLVTTASDIISTMQDHATRLQALCTQARNGTYGGSSIDAINTEAGAIMAEINRLYSTAEYNKVSLFNNKAYEIDPSLPQAGASGFIDETGLIATATVDNGYGDFIVDPKTYEDEYVDILMSVSEAIATGTFVKGGMYKIANIDDLKALATSSCYDRTVILSDDIDLVSESDWVTIQNFAGTLDGNGHIIKNLKIDNTNSNEQGLFGFLSGTIRNLGVVNANVNGKNEVGILVGNSHGGIENCYVTGSVLGENNVGLLAGRSFTRILNCYSKGNVKGTSDVGGLVGNSGASIEDSHSNSKVEGSSSVGGLIGCSGSVITNCYATGNVTGQNSVGGLIGYSYESTTNSYATGNVNGSSSVGGLVGYSGSGGSVVNGYATGNIKGQNSVGGLCGYCATGASITNSYSSADVIGEYYVGGVVGKGQSSIANTYATGDVNGLSFVGGLVGHTISDINNTYATGNVAGDSNVGGLIGKSVDSDIVNSISYSLITGRIDSGAVVGYVESAGSFNLENVNTINMDKPIIGHYYDTNLHNENITKAQEYDTLITRMSVKKIITTLQVGINSDNSNQINLDTNFKLKIGSLNDMASDSALDAIMEFQKILNEKSTELGAVENRLQSALESIEVNIENLTSSLSTIRDADIAEVSSDYIRQQILQQAAATLLATANQSPSIALQLI